jgi:uncharacterized DUF497 family protein
MEFEWDEDNRKAHLAKHGVGFLDVIPLFAGPTLETVDEGPGRPDYGETRINVMGVIDGRVFFVTTTWRGARRRIISARKANPDEQTAYYARHPR